MKKKEKEKKKDNQYKVKKVMAIAIDLTLVPYIVPFKGRHANLGLRILATVSL